MRSTVLSRKHEGDIVSSQFFNQCWLGCNRRPQYLVDWVYRQWRESRLFPSPNTSIHGLHDVDN